MVLLKGHGDIDTLPHDYGGEEDYSWLLDSTVDDNQKADAADPQKKADAAADPQRKAGKADAADSPLTKADAADSPLTKAFKKRKVVYEDETDPKLIVAKPNKRKRLRITDSDFITWTSRRSGQRRREWRWIDDPPSDLESDELALFIE